MDDSQQTLPRERIREIFAIHRGEQEKMAARVGVSKTTISHVLRGKATSRRVLEALRARAIELLAEEQAERNAA